MLLTRLGGRGLDGGRLGDRRLGGGRASSRRMAWSVTSVLPSWFGRRFDGRIVGLCGPPILLTRWFVLLPRPGGRGLGWPAAPVLLARLLAWLVLLGRFGSGVIGGFPASVLLFRPLLPARFVLPRTVVPAGFGGSAVGLFAPMLLSGGRVLRIRCSIRLLGLSLSSATQHIAKEHKEYA